jgi:hypothetical protein
MDGIYGGVAHEYWNRASVHCAPLQTLKSFEDRPKSEKLEAPILYLHCPLPILPPGSSTLQPRHASLPLPTCPRSNLLGFSNLQEHESVLLHRFLALNLPPTLAMWCSCMRSIFSLAFSPYSSQLGHGYFQKERAVVSPG